MVVFLLILTTLLWGTTPIIEKIGLTKIDPLIGVTIRSTIVTAILLALTFATGKGKDLLQVDAKTVTIFGASGVMAGLLAMWTYYTVLKIEPTSKIVPITASYPLVTALLGAFILGEGLTLTKLIGTGLIVSGIWLVR